MAVTKGKPATKGQKQILEENKDTIKFYLIMAIVAMTLYQLATFLWSGFLYSYLLISILAGLTYSSSIFTMKYMAKPAYSESGSLIDGGIDLNMEAGFAEHLKDLIILTCICQISSLISNYFLLLWLLAPGRAFYLLWINILGPWFFQPAPQEEVDEKKQRKMERKMKRAH